MMLAWLKKLLEGLSLPAPPADKPQPLTNTTNSPIWLTAKSFIAPKTVNQPLQPTKQQLQLWLNANIPVTLDHDFGFIRLGVSRLPNDLKVNGQLTLKDLPALSCLPTNLRVEKLYVRHCDLIASLPEDSQISEDLSIESCRNFESLPNHFRVNGDLLLKACPRLLQLPQQMHVEGQLKLSGLRLEKIPDSLTISGDLFIENCARLKQLPVGLTIRGGLTLIDCALEQLPERLTIGGNLHVKRCRNLTSLPASLKCDGNVLVDQCNKFEALPSNRNWPGSLSITNCPNLIELPDGISVGALLKLRNCKNLLNLGKCLKTGTNLRPFSPSDAFRHALDIRGCTSLQSLPDDLSALGRIEIADSGLCQLAGSLQNLIFTWRGVKIPTALVHSPESLSFETIFNEANAEVRRVMLERLGIDNFLAKAGAQILDRDFDPGGSRSLVSFKHPTTSNVVCRFLRCCCPSTGREYLLRVAPSISTCHDAAAWLAGFSNASEYRPIRET